MPFLAFRGGGGGGCVIVFRGFIFKTHEIYRSQKLSTTVFACISHCMPSKISYRKLCYVEINHQFRW